MGKSLILLQLLLLVAKGTLIQISDLECIIFALPNMCDTVDSGLATVSEAVTFIKPALIGILTWLRGITHF